MRAIREFEYLGITQCVAEVVTQNLVSRYRIRACRGLSDSIVKWVDGGAKLSGSHQKL